MAPDRAGVCRRGHQPFQGRHGALVAGGASGLGEATVRRLHADGASVLVNLEVARGNITLAGQTAAAWASRGPRP